MGDETQIAVVEWLQWIIFSTKCNQICSVTCLHKWGVQDHIYFCHPPFYQSNAIKSMWNHQLCCAILDFVCINIIHFTQLYQLVIKLLMSIMLHFICIFTVQWPNYTHQRETTGASSDSLQLRPISKLELLLKERICSQRERILSFKSSSLWYGKSLTSIGDLPWMCTIFIMHVRNCIMRAMPMLFEEVLA